MAEESWFESGQWQEFFFLYNFQTSFYSVGTGVLSLEIMRLKREADHLPPPSVKVKNSWSRSSISPYSVMARTVTVLPFYVLYFQQIRKVSVIYCYVYLMS
jgi:hypothetical protein